MTKINPDAAVMQQLQSRGITEKTGVYGEHKVRLGTGKPIKLDSIKGNHIPFQGFRAVTKSKRGLEGMGWTVDKIFKILTCPGGKLDAQALFSAVKTAKQYEQRIAGLDPFMVYVDYLEQQGSDIAARDGDIDQRVAYDAGEYIDDLSKVCARNLSNADLAAIYQTFNSAKMDVLQTALLAEGRNNPEAKDAGLIASALYDLQSHIIQEVSDRAAAGILKDERERASAQGDADKVRKLDEQIKEVEHHISVRHANDISSSNLTTLALTSALSATAREQTAPEQTYRLQMRDLPAVSVSQMADVLRQSELTINITPEALLSEGGVIDDPHTPLKNIFHLAKHNIKPKGDEYLAERDAIEKKMFPELSGHELNPDERPLYAAINTARYQGGAANRSYGTAVIVLNPEVARRATYIMDDSFFSAAVKIDDRRFSDFYSMLGSSPLPRDLIARVCTKNTPANRDFEEWLKGIANKPNPTVANLSALPESLGIAGEEQQTLFRSLLIECFGDAQGTRKIMATHDNLEALIPRMSGYDGNSLARAAIAAQEGDPGRF